MRVKHVDPIDAATSLHLPGDEKLDQAFKRLEDITAPAEGPVAPGAGVPRILAG